MPWLQTCPWLGNCSSKNHIFRGEPRALWIAWKLAQIEPKVFSVGPGRHGRIWTIYFRPASSAQLGRPVSLLSPSTYLECWRAHDAGSWGAPGTLKRIINPSKHLKQHAVGSVCGCKCQCWQHLHCMTSLRKVLHALLLLRPSHLNLSCAFCMGI